LVVNQKVAWKPVGPSNVARSGAIITIDFDVPNPPLAWDEHLGPPHQSAHTAWAMGHGFEVSDGSTELAIASVTLQATSVVLTLANPPLPMLRSPSPTPKPKTAVDSRADWFQGYRGQLRDSDELVGDDLETIEVDATNGSPVVMASQGFVRRAGHDIVTGGALPNDTIIAKHDSDDQLTLSTPWTGATGKAMLTFHHDQHNYCVHFSMPVP